MAHNFQRYPELTNSQMQVYYFESPHKQITEDFEADVVKVTDGDTIILKTSFRDFNFPLRFLDTNAPEMNEGGRTAKDWLTERILNKKVHITIDPSKRVGKYGRLLGRVMSGGLDIANEMMNLGLVTSFENRNEGKLPIIDKELKQPW